MALPNDELSEASRESDGDVHQRDTLPVPSVAAPRMVSSVREIAATAPTAAVDEDGPPTIPAPPPPLGHAPLLRSLVPATETTRPTQPGTIDAPLAALAARPATEVGEDDDTRPFPLEDADDTRRFPLDDASAIRIPAAPRVPVELKQLVAEASRVEIDEPAMQVEDDELRDHAALVAQELIETINPAREEVRTPPSNAIVTPPLEAPLSLPAAAGPLETSTLAPAIRAPRAEPKPTSVGSVLLLVAALVPLASAAFVLAPRHPAEPAQSPHAATKSVGAPPLSAHAALEGLAPATAASVPALAPHGAPLDPAEAKATAEVAAPEPSVGVVLAKTGSRSSAGRERKLKKAEVPEGPLPDVPSRADVVAALEPLRDAVVTCAAGRHGVAQVDVSVNGNGSIALALVGGDFAGSAEGSCIARTLRRAHFRAFQQPRFRVLYPFSL